ncbi:polyprotein [Sesbania bispinosa]|nr:polyprotein [Sesbania bispinosa]
MKEGSIPVALLYRIQYKVMNTCNSRVLLKPKTNGETTLFVTDMTRANVIVPKVIRWEDIVLPDKWTMDRATPTLPRKTPEIQQIRQSKQGKLK